MKAEFTIKSDTDEVRTYDLQTAIRLARMLNGYVVEHCGCADLFIGYSLRGEWIPSPSIG